MKDRKIFWVVLLLFALLLGGAYTLYDRLGQTVGAEQMIIHSAQPGQSVAQESAPQDGNQNEAAGEARAESEEAGQAESKEEAAAAPDFTVYDKSGAQVKLSQFFGKPIVLNFWASWCGPCQYEMPDFQEKYEALGEDVHFVMVNMTDGARETVETASAFIEKNGYAFPVFYDTKSEAAMTYGAYSLPTSFFIDAKGRVIAQAVGAIDASTLQKGIDMITP